MHRAVHCLTVLGASVLVIGVSQLPAAAEEAPPAGDLITRSSATTIGPAELARDLEPGDSPEDAREASAVDAYLADAPSQGSALDPADVDVATLDLPGDVDAVLVSPDAVEVSSLSVSVDAATNEVTAGTRAGPRDADPVTTSGPGMGSWPSWSDSPSWAVQLRLYYNDNFIGNATFQTQRRRYGNDGSSSHDLWQVARRAGANPDEIEVSGPDINIGVRKLWISSDLQSHDHTQQWRPDLTNPREGFSSCDSNTTLSVGPFSINIGSCSDYDVWQGAVGHYRFDFDSGTYAKHANKSIGYVAGFQMDNGASVRGDWYEFVTLQIMKQGVVNLKCSADTAGEEDGTTTDHCTFG